MTVYSFLERRSVPSPRLVPGRAWPRRRRPAPGAADAIAERPAGSEPLGGKRAD
ncbi:MAG: hypothetical protein OXU54_04360 [Gammaproteobacteria bacterium]|nr:hypothetical protein [Gammaproteobacteria bacterium]